MASLLVPGSDDVVQLAHPAPHVALVVLNRPQARNAVNGAVTRALDRCLKRTEADPDVWVVVLTGAGDKAFCAGADLKDVAAGRMDELVTPDGGFAGFVRAPRTKPWIAAVNGTALAGGLEIALACDMIVASSEATFGLPEVKRGLMALAGGLVRLPRAVTHARALELVATGRAISAETAYAWGLVNRIAGKNCVVDCALELAREIAANAPLAVRESLGVARRAFDCSEVALEEMTAAAGRRLAATGDFHEGPRAFIEKRTPNWTGR